MDPQCTGCGRSVQGGTASCQAMFDGLLARELSRPSYYRLHRKSVDTYCLQHPDTYCASAKSFAAHFTGLCCAFEHGGHPSVLKAVQKWLNGARSIAKPELPLSRGALTIADVFGT